MTSFELNAIWLSLKVSTVALAIMIPFGLALGFILARSRRRWWLWLIESFLNLPMVIPPIVTGYVLLIILSPGRPLGALLKNLGINLFLDWKGAVLAGAIVSFPLLLQGVQTAFEGVDPVLETAARTLGAGPIRVFFTITLPLSTRGVVSGAALAFARCLGEFGATIMIASNIRGKTQTIPLAIWQVIDAGGTEDPAWRLVIVAVAISIAATLASSLLRRRR
ncbi:MAG: molybdate ABC transporter permease subunit [bacterium]|jgi:molybdate transport system permease protein|nr:molybdate ABC transporter permease subunit [bacterium]